MLALLAAAAAWAVDPSPAFLLPGAVPVEPGWGEVTTRFGGGYLAFYGIGPLAAIALTGNGSPARGWTLGGSLVVGSIGQPGDPVAMGGGSLATRAVLFDGERVSVALVASGGGWPGGKCCIGGWYAGAGVAAEGGGAVRWDVTLPVAFFGGSLGEPYQWPTVGGAFGILALIVEGGVTFPVGEQHRIRVGKYPGAIGATWRSDWQRTHLEFTLATSLILSYAGLEIGHAFGRAP